MPAKKPSAAKPAAKPTAKVGKPAGKIAKPAGKASKPAGKPAAKPAAKVAKPAAKTAKPAGKVAKPAAKTAKPAGKVAKPAAKTAKPAGKVAKSAAKTAKPAAKTTQKKGQQTARKTVAKKGGKTSTNKKTVQKHQKGGKKVTKTTKTSKTKALLKPKDGKVVKKKILPKKINFGRLKRDPRWWKKHIKNRKKALRPKQYVIDCSLPVQDGIMDAASFEKYFHDHYRHPNVKRPSKLGPLVTVTRDKARLLITPHHVQLSKYKLKAVAKRYLRRQQLRDWVRVIANDKAGLQFRYYNIQEAGDEDEEEENES